MASKSINFSSITSKLLGFKQRILKYTKLIFIVVLLGMYSFLVFNINSLINSEPSDEAVAEKLQTAQRPKIDKQAVIKLQELQDNSTNVQALFKEARDNPFQE